MFSTRRHAWLLALLFAVPTAQGAAQTPNEGGSPSEQTRPVGRRGPMSIDDRLKQIATAFNLTTDQQGKVKPILEADLKKRQDLVNAMHGDRQSMRPKLQQIQRDTNNQVRAVLDDKQKEVFDKIEQERQQRMQTRPGHMRLPGGSVQPPPQK